MAAVDKTLLYVGIDLGKTSTGYGYRFKQQDNIRVNHNWGGDFGFKSYKTPTCVLTDDSDDFVAFGVEAQAQYRSNEESDSDSNEESDSESDDSDEPKHSLPNKGLHYYDEFALMLHGEEVLSSNMKLKAHDGHECSALQIFAMSLRFLKKKVLSNVGSHMENIPQTDEIMWVLTASAIWSESAKQFMRECALDAGLIDDLSSTRLLIALGPEAAALYCRTLPLSEFILKDNIPSGEGQVMKREGLPRDSHYLVVDCGGDTVNISAHHYKENGDICELYYASIGGLGGRDVNRQFEKTMDGVFGAELMNKYKESYPGVYLNEMRMFEKDKRRLDFRSQKTKYNFNCSRSFISFCERMNGNRRIQHIVKEKQAEHNISYSNGMLRFSEQVLYDIFLPTVNQIKKHVLNLLDQQELKHVRFIYFVGGFSDCLLLQKIFKEEFTQGYYKNKNTQVILAPFEANLAVVKGAVLFGSDPHSISSQRARRFYCYSKEISNSAKVGNSKKVLIPIITQNEEIHELQPKMTYFNPSHEDKTFKLYHYKQDNITNANVLAKYTTDKDVRVTEIDVSNVIGSNCTADTKLAVYLFLKHAWLQVTVRNTKNARIKPLKVSINILSH